MRTRSATAHAISSPSGRKETSQTDDFTPSRAGTKSDHSSRLCILEVLNQTNCIELYRVESSCTEFPREIYNDKFCARLKVGFEKVEFFLSKYF